jgi:hypothetical protein
MPSRDDFGVIAGNIGREIVFDAGWGFYTACDRENLVRRVRGDIREREIERCPHEGGLS